MSAGARLAAATDEELMRGVQAGDPEAFGALYDRYAAPAWKLALGICRDAGRAEDAVQEAFLTAWRSRARYESGRGSVRNWLMALVCNRSIDSLRREGPSGGSLQDEVIALAYFAELSHAEIAATLDLPPGTVKGRMRLGLMKLRDHIGETSMKGR